MRADAVFRLLPIDGKGVWSLLKSLLGLPVCLELMVNESALYTQKLKVLTTLYSVMLLEAVICFCPGRLLPYQRLMGMCHWMGSHFHDWNDYNGVAHFRFFCGKTILHIYGLQTYQNVCTADGK